MGEDKISVIIPVYKVEQYLDKCVESVINQTYKNLEIILVDDGSPDNCPKMCDEWAKKDNRVKVIHKKNGGLSDARNVGIENATGTYIAFLDSDDYFDPTYCKTLHNLISKNSADVASTYLNFVYENEEDAKQHEQPIIEQKDEVVVEGIEVIKLLFNPPTPYFVMAQKMYKKEIFNNLRFTLNRLHEDDFLYYQVLAKTKKLVYTTKPLYNYLQRSGSIMHTRKDKSFIDFHDAYIEKTKFIEENYPEFKQDIYALLVWKFRYYYRRMNKKIISKEVRNMWLNSYKKYYKLLNKKSLKDMLFYFFPFI